MSPGWGSNPQPTRSKQVALSILSYQGAQTRESPADVLTITAGDNYSIGSVTSDMPEEEAAPKIDFKALETITKKVLEHQPAKKRKPTPKLTAGGEKHVNE